jgi:hypothetical protein
MVVPALLIFSSNDTIWILRSGSKLPVGSSQRRTNGLLAKALAIATLVCSPPES